MQVSLWGCRKGPPQLYTPLKLLAFWLVSWEAAKEWLHCSGWLGLFAVSVAMALSIAILDPTLQVLQFKVIYAYVNTTSVNCFY